MSAATLLLIVLLVLAAAALPAWSYSREWGYAPSGILAAAGGVVWIIGRIIYRFGYVADANKRGPGFGIQALASFVLLFGALGRIIWAMTTAA